MSSCHQAVQSLICSLQLQLLVIVPKSTFHSTLFFVVTVKGQHRSDIDIPPPDTNFDFETTPVMRVSSMRTTQLAKEDISPTPSEPTLPVVARVTLSPVQQTSKKTTLNSNLLTTNTKEERQQHRQQQVSWPKVDKETIKYAESTGKPLDDKQDDLTDISDVGKSVDVSKDPSKVYYIIGGTAAGVVALIAGISVTLGVLAAKGKFAPTGFGPVETAV